MENGEHTPLACGLRRRAANFSTTDVLHQTVGRLVRTKPAARRRRQHAGRMRSPFSTASFRLKGPHKIHAAQVPPFRAGGFCLWWTLTRSSPRGGHIAGRRPSRNHALPPRRIVAELHALEGLRAEMRRQAETAAELNTLLPTVLIRNFREGINL